MENEIYFFRDLSNESEEAKKVLDEHNVNYEEIYTMSDRELPCVISADSALPFSGYEGVNLYVSFFAS